MLSFHFNPRCGAVSVNRQPQAALSRPQRQFKSSRLPTLFYVPVDAARILFEGVAHRDAQTALFQGFVDEALEGFNIYSGG